MALTSTTLAAAMTANAVSFKPTASTGATVGGFAKIDLEYMVVTGIDASGNVAVRSRGDLGGLAVQHYSGASVTFGLGTDLSTLGPGEIKPTPFDDEDMLTYDSDDAIAFTMRRTLVGIRKGSAAAMTLAAPSKERNGTEVIITGLTDFAHVVTGSVYAGVSGAKTTLTSAAFRGSTITLVAFDGAWYVRSNFLFVIS